MSIICFCCRTELVGYCLKTAVSFSCNILPLCCHSKTERPITSCCKLNWINNMWTVTVISITLWNYLFVIPGRDTLFSCCWTPAFQKTVLPLSAWWKWAGSVRSVLCRQGTRKLANQKDGTGMREKARLLLFPSALTRRSAVSEQGLLFLCELDSGCWITKPTNQNCTVETIGNILNSNNTCYNLA